MTERELLETLRNNPDLAVIDQMRHGIVGAFQIPESVLRGQPQPKLSEHDLQAAVIAECDRRAILRPEYGLIFAIPNGGARHPAVAAKLKAEGVKAGVPDLFLPVARHGYHGMFIELKVGDNKPSQVQLDMIRNLIAERYFCKAIWDSVDAVMDWLVWYLEG